MHDLPLFYAPDVEHTGLLPDDEAGHALRVLRMEVGDSLQVADGKGSLWLGQIAEISKKLCRVDLLEPMPWQAYWCGEITLLVSPTKSMERMEWLLEKAVEIGLDRIILLRSKHSERKHINAERLNKILVSAMKQSQKALLPTLEVGLSLEDALRATEGSERLVLHCRAVKGLTEREAIHRAYRGGGSVALFVGPEGDFSIDEIRQMEEAGAKPTTLGQSRLRTETAALVALQWIHSLQMIAATK